MIVVERQSLHLQIQTRLLAKMKIGTKSQWAFSDGRFGLRFDLLLGLPFWARGVCGQWGYT